MILWLLVRRELMQLLRSVHGLGPLLLAMAIAGGGLVWLLQRAEGTVETLPALWGVAVSAGLPFLAAVAASRGFTQDRENGMLRLMFATPVRARTWVMGKVMAAWWLCVVYVAGMALSCWVLCHWLVPQNAYFPMSWIGFVWAGGALMMLAWVWCALGTVLSLFSKSSASTFLLSLLGCLFLPPLICEGKVAFGGGLSGQWRFFPLQELVYDCAGGVVDIRGLVGCAVATVVLVYIGGLIFDALRVCATER